MTTVSCIVITTLIVVSLANLVLLVHIIIQTYKKCEDCNKIDEIEKFQNKMEDFMENMIQNHQTSIAKYKFMAAILLMENNEINFICSAAIISKKWALTAAHCSERLLSYPINKLRLSTNSTKWRYGIWHNLDKIIIHDNFHRFRPENDISLISVRQPFKSKTSLPIALSSPIYQYLANTSATILGWAKPELVQNEQMYAMEVRLFWHKLCEIFYPDDGIYEKGLFCAGKYKNEDRVCVFDFGGPLIQKNVLIGMISYGIGCGVDEKPAVYTKLALFQNWIRIVENRNGVNIGIVFKT